MLSIPRTTLLMLALNGAGEARAEDAENLQYVPIEDLGKPTRVRAEVIDGFAGLAVVAAGVPAISVGACAWASSMGADGCGPILVPMVPVLLPLSMAMGVTRAGDRHGGHGSVGPAWLGAELGMLGGLGAGLLLAVPVGRVLFPAAGIALIPPAVLGGALLGAVLGYERSHRRGLDTARREGLAVDSMRILVLPAPTDMGLGLGVNFAWI